MTPNIIFYNFTMVYTAMWAQWDPTAY